MEFRSASSALKWAYQIMGNELCKTSSIYSMGGVGRDASRELTGLERRGQAAMIVGMMARAAGEGSPGHAYLLMQYGRDGALLDVLVRYVATGLTTGAHSRCGIEKCLRSYCGQEIGISALCKDIGVNRAAAMAYRKNIYARMDSLHRVTIAAAEDALRAAGLIEIAA